MERKGNSMKDGELHSNSSGTLVVDQEFKCTPDIVYVSQTEIHQEQCTPFQRTIHKIPVYTPEHTLLQIHH